jgi:type IV pilus assembly protein PilC
VWKDVAEGTSLTDAFVNAQIFPDEFLQVVATAEETGTVPEQLSRMSHIFEDQARRSMSRLTAVLSGTVWVFTAGLIIYFIFRLAMIYVGTLNEANRQVFG